MYATEILLVLEQASELKFMTAKIQHNRFVSRLWKALQRIKMRQVIFKMKLRFKKMTKKKPKACYMKRKRNFTCSHCGALNDHKRPTCPQKLAEADRNQICYRVCLANGHPAAHLA